MSLMPALLAVATGIAAISDRVFDFIEGDRAFDITWGLLTGGLCLAVAVPLLWWILPKYRRSFFGPRLDPSGALQFSWGIFAMMMAWTNVGCRAIDHLHLSWVHPGFFGLTLLVLTVLGPRLAHLLWEDRRPAAALLQRSA